MAVLSKEEVVACQLTRVMQVKRILRRHKNDPLQKMIWRGRLEEAEQALAGLNMLK